jgi:putative chitinase
MMLNKKKFFDAVRWPLFKGKLTASQVKGMEAIIDYFSEKYPANNPQLAYILATAYHETGRLFEAVREGYANTDEKAVAHVTNKLFKPGLIRVNYAAREPNGKSYYGRGLVQITWAGNYRRMGRFLGVDLYGNPDLALDLKIAVPILVDGMMKYGYYTGAPTVPKYIKGTEVGKALDTAFTNARFVVNGVDARVFIASYATKFLTALKDATT